MEYLGRRTVHAGAVKFTISGQKLSRLGPPNVVGVLLVLAQPRNTCCVLLGSSWCETPQGGLS